VQPFIIYTHRQHPELEAQIDTFGKVWPEFIFHGEAAAQYYHHTTTTFADFNLYLCAADGNLVAVGLALPLAWDGQVETLPEGWDAALERGVRDYEHQRRPTTLCALGIMVRQERQGEGWSTQALRAMKAAAAEHDREALIAPVRPTLKSVYPLTPMDRYIQWRRDDGSPFDPWIRVHWREGATILRIAARSMLIKGTVAEWETWAAMRFPDTGRYVIPGALDPIMIDREVDVGTYVEPNVWMVHRAVSQPGLDGPSRD